MAIYTNGAFYASNAFYSSGLEQVDPNFRHPGEIVYLYYQRRMQRGPLIDAMDRVRLAYNGDIAIPLPELSKNEPSAVPNLVAQGLDQTAMRISSVLPDIRYHPERAGFKKWEETVRLRRQVNLGWWDDNAMKLKMRRRARWIIGYVCSPVLLRPSRNFNGPEWHLRNPLATYPAPTDSLDAIRPPNCIFAYTRTVDWVTRNYPDVYQHLKRDIKCSPDHTLTLLEYVDDKEFTTVIVSSKYSPNEPTIIDATQPYTTPSVSLTPALDRTGVTGSLQYAILERTPNRTGLSPAVVPGRITLDREQGQYDGIVGMYQTMAMLFALETRAVIQGVWPDTWAVGRANETVEVITEADGRAGIIGKLQGGDIKTMVENPGYMTNPTLDRLERYQRVGAGIPAEFGAESATNVRTGRRGQDIISAAVDFPVQEAQILFEESLREENITAVEIDKAYFGNMSKSYYVNWPKAQGQVTYTPNDLWNTAHHTVHYALPGTDINNLTIITGQLRGLELISAHLGMELNPLIEDIELEKDRISAEKIEDAAWMFVQQQIASGQMPVEAVVELGTLIRTNKMDPIEALAQVQAKIQAMQAANAGPPVDPNDPAAQPGMSSPGAGSEAGVTVQPPDPSIQNLAGMLGSLYPGTAAIRQGGR